MFRFNRAARRLTLSPHVYHQRIRPCAAHNNSQIRSFSSEKKQKREHEGRKFTLALDIAGDSNMGLYGAGMLVFGLSSLYATHKYEERKKRQAEERAQRVAEAKELAAQAAEHARQMTEQAREHTARTSNKAQDKLEKLGDAWLKKKEKLKQTLAQKNVERTQKK